MTNVPAIPMIKILTQFARANNVPLNIRSWESIMRCYRMYIKHAEILN